MSQRALTANTLGSRGRICVLDTETTGLGADHRVVEIGVVEIINRRPTGREFQAYINPERSIDPEAQSKHGLSAQFLADKPKFREICTPFIEFVGDEGILVAHNARFDIDKLNAELQRVASTYRLDQRFEIIDTLKLSREQSPGQRATVDAIATRLGVSLREREQTGFHGALADARILSRIFLAMTAGQANFGYSEGREDHPAMGAKLDRSKLGPLKVVYATPDELNAHSRLCNAIEKASGGYCGFRGKWSKQENEAVVVAALSVPAPEFGSDTAAPARSGVHPAASTALSSTVTPNAPARARVVSGGSNTLEFSPSI